MTDSKQSLPEVPLPLTQSMSSHGASKSREHVTPDTSPHGHGHGHALGHAQAQNHAHAQAGHHAHAQYPLGLPAAPFLSNPSLFNIKSEPSNAAGYDSYPAHSGPHYHSQQHYLHALQVSSVNRYKAFFHYPKNWQVEYIHKIIFKFIYLHHDISRSKFLGCYAVPSH